MNKQLRILALFLIYIYAPLYSQEKNKEVNFFLDCKDCDLVYIRQELPFVSFVRDPLLADVHIIVTDSGTGSGGRKYYLNFIGKNEFSGINNEYVVITDISDTGDTKRKSLLQAFQTGILQYYFKSGFSNRLNIKIEDKESLNADQRLFDRWNKWLFSVESGGQFEKEESRNEYSFTTGASVKKTTESWKGALNAEYEINHGNYYDDSAHISNRQNAKEISIRYIKSLSERWSARIYGEYSADTYTNIKSRFAGSLAVEYNIFPWKESHRKIFVIRYDAGIGTYEYLEETIYDKLRETLLTEALEVHIELIQPWGQISAGLEGSHLFHDFSKNRLTFESDLSLRITKNASVFCNIESNMIHDQYYLPKGDVSLDDLLLKRRQLATTYEMNGELGFRFIFGSIYNNVVNERF